jgi:16S rRNA (guanine527-N7)-methyltransferase
VTTSEPDDLPAALVRHNIELDSDQVDALSRYVHSLWSWNEKLNLTRHTDYEKFVSRDVVDSRQLEQFLEPGERILDVGTGGGVPGVILSILRPDLQVVLCESMAKKARAVEAIVKEAGLDVPVRHARAEELLANESFGTLVVRAVAPLAKLLRWFAPYWDSFNHLLIIKGPAWVDERHEAREAGLLRKLDLRKIDEYPLPGTNSNSVILSIRPKDQA